VPYLLWALPAGVRNLPIYFKIFNYLEYDIWKMFDKVDEKFETELFVFC
jgi:hypothetical protein